MKVTLPGGLRDVLHTLKASDRGIKIRLCYMILVILCSCLVFTLQFALSLVDAEGAFAQWLLSDIPSILIYMLMCSVIVVFFTILHDWNQYILNTETLKASEQWMRMQLEKEPIIDESNREIKAYLKAIREQLAQFSQLGDDGTAEAREVLIHNLRTAVETDHALIHCGNALVDSICAVKHRQMKKKGVKPVWRIGAIPNELSVNDMELCALLSNALDNAIEACMQLPEGVPPQVETEILWDEQALMVKISNPCIGASKKAKTAFHLSDKRKNEPGLGLASIRQVVRANHGEILLDSAGNDDLFVFRVYLPLTETCAQSAPRMEMPV